MQINCLRQIIQLHHLVCGLLPVQIHCHVDWKGRCLPQYSVLCSSRFSSRNGNKKIGKDPKRCDRKSRTTLSGNNLFADNMCSDFGK